MKIICILYTRFFWQLCEEDRVKSLVKGLDKKSLVRGLHSPDTFDVSKNPSSEMGKKVNSLIQNWMESKGSNDTWAREFWVYFLLLPTSKYHIIIFSLRRLWFTEFFLNISVKFYIAEVMNLANAVAQFFFTDYFLDGHFATVGYHGLFLEENETVMPILSSCAFKM